jgi:RNA polymerase sigma factor (sigma-70 family)
MERVDKIGELYKNNKKLFFYVIKRKNYNMTNDEMNDLIHDMCYKLLKSNFDPFDKSAKSYMRSTLETIMIDRFKAKKLPTTFVDDYHYDIGKNDHNNITRETLLKDIKKVLSERECYIVTLLEQGYRGTEISEMLNIPIDGTKSILFKMRKRIKENNLLSEYRY